MTLKDRVTEDMKAAMRAKDADRLSTIRMLLAACKQKEVDERVVLDDAAVVAVKHGASQRSAVAGGRAEGFFDEAHAHVVGGLPACELARAEVDAGREVEVRAVGDGEVGDVADIPAVRLADAEVPPDQVGELASGLVRDRRLHPASQPDPRELMFAHHPRDPLVVHPR